MNDFRIILRSLRIILAVLYTPIQRAFPGAPNEVRAGPSILQFWCPAAPQRIRKANSGGVSARESGVRP